MVQGVEATGTGAWARISCSRAAGMGDDGGAGTGSFGAYGTSGTHMIIGTLPVLLTKQPVANWDLTPCRTSGRRIGQTAFMQSPWLVPNQAAVRLG